MVMGAITISIDFMWECKQNNIQPYFLPLHTSHIPQPLDLGCFVPEKQRYQAEAINLKMATLSDTAQSSEASFHLMLLEGTGRRLV
jgi:hypothetical protein